MKARKRDSNDEWKDVIYVQLEGSDIIYKERYLEFQHDNLSTELKTYDQVDEEKHWQDVRERVAIAAMHAILSNTGNKVYQSSLDIISKNAVTIADALIKQLKGE